MGSPTKSPTDSPTKSPTESPTEAPTKSPTDSPTKAPTHAPTPPTNSPTLSPTWQPTQPTNTPTAAPTLSDGYMVSGSMTFDGLTESDVLNESFQQAFKALIALLTGFDVDSIVLIYNFRRNTAVGYQAQ